MPIDIDKLRHFAAAFGAPVRELGLPKSELDRPPSATSAASSSARSASSSSRMEPEEARESKRIEKMPHACAVHVKKEQPVLPKKADQPAPTPPTPPSPADFKEMLLQVHHYIKQNFEDVGSRFAEEARQIHQGKAEERPIHGTATAKETADLAEEGVPFVTLPKPELDS